MYANDHTTNNKSSRPATRDGDWYTVPFTRNKKTTPTKSKEAVSTSQEPGIDIKLFNVATGNYIITQKLKYIPKDSSTVHNNVLIPAHDPNFSNNLSDENYVKTRNRFSAIKLDNEQMVLENTINGSKPITTNNSLVNLPLKTKYISTSLNPPNDKSRITNVLNTLNHQTQSNSDANLLNRDIDNPNPYINDNLQSASQTTMHAKTHMAKQNQTNKQKCRPP